MKAYFDTSVLVTLTLQEEHWPKLFSWIVERMPIPFYSDFGWGGYVSAVGLNVRRGTLARVDVMATITEIDDYLRSWTRLRLRRSDMIDAAEMLKAFDLGLRFPDAIHIAIARRQGLTLVSADRKQLAAARHFGLSAVSPYEP